MFWGFFGLFFKMLLRSPEDRTTFHKSVAKEKRGTESLFPAKRSLLVYVSGPFAPKKTSKSAKRFTMRRYRSHEEMFFHFVPDKNGQNIVSEHSKFIVALLSWIWSDSSCQKYPAVAEQTRQPEGILLKVVL